MGISRRRLNLIFKLHRSKFTPYRFWSSLVSHRCFKLQRSKFTRNYRVTDADVEKSFKLQRSKFTRAANL